MKTLKKVLLVIAIIIAIPLVTALFVGNDFMVERSTEINRPKEEVFNYIKHLKNQDQFSVWAQADPNMKKEFRGEDATVGFVSAWDSQNENVGKGEQEIKTINEGRLLETELRFFKPFESKASANFITEDAGENKTRVRWNFNSKMPYPMNIMLLFGNMDEMLGTDLQKGLDNLKKNLEAPQKMANS